ncbi:AAA family ATPase [Rhodococcoides kyotonense]|uniref:AAA family ATPase n=1 Tax=Rhodococcoides kyotonense TaxID=398843 RepID=UPI000A00CBE8|nr:AAA family ATPase [Rhodococcus kyotonensis]
MEHLSEVVKILDAALMHNTEKAASYANLLASKLDEDRQPRQARAIRSVLAKLPSPVVGTSQYRPRPPQDSENAFSTVDYTPVEELDQTQLVLHRYVEDRLLDFLESVRLHDDLRAQGVSTSNRLLLYGPPGTGKTSLANHIAHTLKLPLVVSRSDSLVSSLLGQTSRNIRNIFEYASGMPCVLFLDEFDALAKDRKDSREIGELQRVVIALLQNIDSLSPSTVLIGATNHPQLLDPAVWRRFDHTLKLALPGESERVQIWGSNLQHLNVPDASLEALAELSEGMSGAAIKTSANDIRRLALRDPHIANSLPRMLQRVARILWFDTYERFDSQAAEISALRTWAPKIFTVRALQDLFGVSSRQVTKAIKD